MFSVTPPDAERPVPPCPKCQHPHVVRAYTADCPKAIQFFACKDCGHLFASRIDEGTTVH